MATTDKPDQPIGSHHVSSLTPYNSTNTNPIYPIRPRGRPQKQQPIKEPSTAHTDQSIDVPENNTHHQNQDDPKINKTTSVLEIPQQDNPNLRRSTRMRRKRTYS